jgi:hypothetical protein
MIVYCFDRLEISTIRAELSLSDICQVFEGADTFTVKTDISDKHHQEIRFFETKNQGFPHRLLHVIRIYDRAMITPLAFTPLETESLMG